MSFEDPTPTKRPFDESTISSVPPVKKIRLSQYNNSNSSPNTNNSIAPGSNPHLHSFADPSLSFTGRGFGGDSGRRMSMASQPDGLSGGGGGGQSMSSSESQLQKENQQLLETVARLTREKQQARNREASLLFRLAKKEEEVQTLLTELQDQARQINPELDMTKRKLLDPTMSLLWKVMRNEVREKDEHIKQLEADLHGVQFTPNSITGKRLIAKIRALQTENEELGRLLSRGRIEQLTVEVVLHRKMVEQLKHTLQEANQLVVELDQEAETMQSTIFNLQARLKRFEESISEM
ncbi:hypothetical protein BJ742DRAFT_553197 [Cladochytrium replicatum]|nr:hypothetical protein BJ742DRAFT_553197 [Cladochytrium replicatum]